MLNNPEQKSRRTRGRRPRTESDAARGQIVAAARTQFAERGYAGTTFRTVAAAAGVDPSLIVHFHGDKAGLFRAALALPQDPAPTVEALLAGPRRTLGERLMRALLALTADPASRAVLLGRVRCAATEPAAAAMVREQIAGDIVGPLVRRLGVDRPELRAGLVSTQLIGWVVGRWIVEVDALARVDDDQVVAELGPVLQRYLVRPLG